MIILVSRANILYQSTRIELFFCSAKMWRGCALCPYSLLEPQITGIPSTKSVHLYMALLFRAFLAAPFRCGIVGTMCTAHCHETHIRRLNSVFTNLAKRCRIKTKKRKFYEQRVLTVLSRKNQNICLLFGMYQWRITLFKFLFFFGEGSRVCSPFHTKRKPYNLRLFFVSKNNKKNQTSDILNQFMQKA